MCSPIFSTDHWLRRLYSLLNKACTPYSSHSTTVIIEVYLDFFPESVSQIALSNSTSPVEISEKVFFHRHSSQFLQYFFDKTSTRGAYELFSLIIKVFRRVSSDPEFVIFLTPITGQDSNRSPEYQTWFLWS